MIKKCIILVLLLGVICGLFAGCEEMFTPPSVEESERLFRENYEDIQTVISFSLRSDYEKIYFDDTSGTMYADLNDVLIEDEDVRAAVKRLIGNKVYKHISVRKRNNAIEFMQWSRTYDEAWSGIAYSINGIDEPDVFYCTQMTPLPETGWYYYLCEYNEWRAEQPDY